MILLSSKMSFWSFWSWWKKRNWINWSKVKSTTKFTTKRRNWTAQLITGTQLWLWLLFWWWWHPNYKQNICFHLAFIINWYKIWSSKNESTKIDMHNWWRLKMLLCLYTTTIITGIRTTAWKSPKNYGEVKLLKFHPFSNWKTNSFFDKQIFFNKKNFNGCNHHPFRF